MGIDILQEQPQWKLELKSIRDVVRQVEEKVIYNNNILIYVLYINNMYCYY